MFELDQRDRELLTELQKDIPLVSTPFAFIGQNIEMSEKEVVKRSEKLRREGVLRRIALLFDKKALGYESALVAAEVGDGECDRAASTVGLHPGVTQNFKRNDALNLWFSLAVSPQSKLGLARTVEMLGSEIASSRIRLFSTLRELGSDGEKVRGQQAPLSSADIDMIRHLNLEVPLQPRPWDVAGRALGMSGDEVLASVQRFASEGKIRRMTAIVARRQPFKTHALCVWSVSADQLDDFAAGLTGESAVSKCYLRTSYPDWPYNVYATLQTRSVQEAESLVGEIGARFGHPEMKLLFPTREYKSVPLSLFSAGEAAWETQRLAPGEAALSAS